MDLTRGLMDIANTNDSYKSEGRKNKKRRKKEIGWRRV